MKCCELYDRQFNEIQALKHEGSTFKILTKIYKKFFADFLKLKKKYKAQIFRDKRTKRSRPIYHNDLHNHQKN